MVSLAIIYSNYGCQCCHALIALLIYNYYLAYKGNVYTFTPTLVLTHRYTIDSYIIIYSVFAFCRFYYAILYVVLKLLIKIIGYKRV